MKKPIQISIPSPCHENWDAMTPADKGRFCASCQKTVYDFTNSSDREIASILKNTNNACGRFRATQLDRDLFVPKEKSTIWIAASAAIVSFLTIGNHTISAQTPVNTEQHVSETDDIVGKTSLFFNSKKNITGSIYDENRKPLEGAYIVNSNTKTNTGTDSFGRFSIEAEEGDVIEISFVGYETSQITIKNFTSFRTQLKPSSVTLGEVVYRRTFFGRVFHSIGNIFR